MNDFFPMESSFMWKKCRNKFLFSHIPPGQGYLVSVLGEINVTINANFNTLPSNGPLHPKILLHQTFSTQYRPIYGLILAIIMFCGIPNK